MATGRTATTKEGTYENVEVGERFGPIEVPIADHKIKAHAFAVNDYNPWSFGSDSPFGGAIRHAAVLNNDLLTTFLSEYDPSSIVGLHTEEQLWFCSPVVIDETAVFPARHTDKYQKRGKGCVVLEAEARGTDVRLLVKHRGVEIMRITPGPVVGRATVKEGNERRVTGGYRQDLEPVSSARWGIEPGTPVVPLVKHVTQEQMSVFSGIGKHFQNVHTSIEVARRGGLDRCLAQVMMETCYLTELLAGFFGASWYTGRVGTDEVHLAGSCG